MRHRAAMPMEDPVPPGAGLRPRPTRLDGSAAHLTPFPQGPTPKCRRAVAEMMPLSACYRAPSACHDRSAIAASGQRAASDKDAHPDRRHECCNCGIAWGSAAPAGPVAGPAEHSTLRAGGGERAGPRTEMAAPSGAHRQMRGTERVNSPAPLLRGVAGCPPQKG